MNVDSVAEELDEPLARLADASERGRLYQTIVERLHAVQPEPNRVTRADLMGGVASAALVFACSFPAILPFLVIDDPHVALRVSNGILLTLLFLVGYRAARYTVLRTALAGGIFVLVGTALVVAAIALDG